MNRISKNRLPHSSLSYKQTIPFSTRLNPRSNPKDIGLLGRLTPAEHEAYAIGPHFGCCGLEDDPSLQEAIYQMKLHEVPKSVDGLQRGGYPGRLLPQV